MIALDGLSTSFSNTGSSRRAKLADAAEQFEAMMLQELLKPMRTSEDDLSGEKSPDGALNGSMDTIASFGTEAVAKAIARSGGLGIAKQVIHELSLREQDPKNVIAGKE